MAQTHSYNYVTSESKIILGMVGLHKKGNKHDDYRDSNSINQKNDLSEAI